MEESRPGLEESRRVDFINEKNKSDNGFYISGMVCGIKINFLLVLDSGSTASLLSSAEGQDFLPEFVYHINYKTKLLHTERATIQCWTANDHTATEVKIKRTVSIPANHGVLVPVSLADGSDLTEIGFLEQLSTFDDEIQVLDGLVNTKSDQIYVNILNHSDRPLMVQGHTTVGICRNVHKVEQDSAKQTVSIKADPSQALNNEETLPDNLLELFQRSSIHLDEEQKDALFQLIMEYIDVISSSSDDLWCTNIIKHKIDTGNERPVRQPLRRQPLAKRNTERERKFRRC